MITPAVELMFWIGKRPRSISLQPESVVDFGDKLRVQVSAEDIERIIEAVSE